MARSVRSILVTTVSKINARRMLEAFMPRAGIEYSRSRNVDDGPKHPMTVFGLAPWVRFIPAAIDDFTR